MTGEPPALHPGLRAMLAEAASLPPMETLPVAIIRKGTPRALATNLPPV